MAIIAIMIVERDNHAPSGRSGRHVVGGGFINQLDSTTSLGMYIIKRTQQNPIVLTYFATLIIQAQVIAYGEAPGQVIGIALLTDTDNTKTETKAYYGDIELIRKNQK